MIHIKTVYACDGCKMEISPSVNFCPNCGAKQPESDGRLAYNLFSTRDRKEFHMTYGGDPILTREDMESLIKGGAALGEYSEYFVGTYYLGSSTFIKVSSYIAELKIENWWPVFRSGLGVDQGERVITLNFLE